MIAKNSMVVINNIHLTTVFMISKTLQCIKYLQYRDYGHQDIPPLDLWPGVIKPKFMPTYNIRYYTIGYIKLEAVIILLL